MKNNKKMSNGITLIALVVTIIVLLILAGISIMMLTGDNGIVNRVGDAKTLTEIGQEQDIISLAYNSAVAKKVGNRNSSTITDSELNEELDVFIGEGKSIVYKENNNTLNVYFTETEHNYNINNGKITIVDDRLNPVEVTGSSNNLELLRGEQKQISLEYTGMVKNITYNSSNTTIATVDDDGIVTSSSNNTGISNIEIVITDYFGNTTTKTCTVTVNMGIARTNNKDYSSIQNAINAVSDDSGTVTLLINLTDAQTISVASGKKIVLDLASKSIIGDQYALITIRGTGSIIIKNGTITNNRNGVSAAISCNMTSTGTLTLENLTCSVAQHDCILQNGSGTFNIISGTYTNRNGGCALDAWASNGTSLVERGTVNVKGGIFNGDICLNGYSKVILNISGGIINSSYKVSQSAIFCDGTSLVNLNVTGGTFNTSKYGVEFKAGSGSINATITGGTWNCDSYLTYIRSGNLKWTRSLLSGTYRDPYANGGVTEI